jgi:hypothetical protein
MITMNGAKEIGRTAQSRSERPKPQNGYTCRWSRAQLALHYCAEKSTRSAGAPAAEEERHMRTTALDEKITGGLAPKLRALLWFASGQSSRQAFAAMGLASPGEVRQECQGHAALEFNGHTADHKPLQRAYRGGR